MTMKNNASRYFIYIIAILFQVNAFASIPYSFGNYDIKQVTEIPQSEINAIHEDRNGFIWFASLDGLYRYDGHQCKEYSLRANRGVINSNMILAINEDSRGNIWVSTYGKGLSVINPQTGEVVSYTTEELFPQYNGSFDIGTFNIDKDDYIWAGSWRAIMKLKINDDNSITPCSIYPISHDDEAKRDFINVIHIDRDNNIWVGSNQTIRMIKGEEDGRLLCEVYEVAAQDVDDYGEDSIVVIANDITLLKKESGQERYSIEVVKHLPREATRIVSVSDSSLWVGGRNGFAHLQKDTNMEWSLLDLFDKDNLPFEMTTCVVSAIIHSRQGVIWAGTRGGGVVRVNQQNKRFNNFPQDMKNARSAPLLLVKALFEDKSGNIWIGTEHNGVAFQAKGSLYGTGATFLDVNNFDNRAYAFEQCSDDIVWVGTCYPHGLVAYNSRTLRPVKQRVEDLTLGFVFALKMSDQNTLWAGTYNNGLWRLDVDSSGQVLRCKNFNTRNSTLSSNIIRSLFIADDGDLWIATDVGINRIGREALHDEMPLFYTSPSANSAVDLLNYYVLQITQLSSGDILFGTMGSGLGCYSKDRDTLQFITTDNGLANNSVKSIIESPTDSNCVWVSTNRGLSKCNLSTLEAINYDSADGIIDCEFSEICGLQLSSEEFAFGNRTGVVTFNPENITPSDLTPTLFLTDLYINHKLITVGEKYNNRVVLEKNLQYTTSLELEYDQRNFSIGFVGLNFATTQGCKYHYKLNGVDKDWVEVREGNQVATYTNIDEGEYRFMVKGANSDGVWSEDTLELDLVINPPIFRSTVAYIIYALLLAALLYLVYWIVALVLSKRREVFEAHVEQRKAEEVIQHKLEFFMNISHEFRTPLTLINIPLEKLISKSKKEENSEVVGNLSEIKYNVNMLMSLINQLLDFRKVERGKEQLSPVSTNMAEYLNSYFEYFKPLAERNNIIYTYDNCGRVIVSDIDRQLFEKVIINILSNAFKYTNAGDSICLSLYEDRERERVIISVRDSGRGVPKEEIPQLFDRFYQGQNRVYSVNGNKGSGIGLSLCKGVVELHAGDIMVNSDINQGFECVVELPLSQSSEGESLSAEAAVSTDCISIVEDMLYDSDRVGSIGRNNESRGTLLIVEDNEHLRMQLSQQLQDEYDVIMAEDGAQGLAMCMEHKPTLVVTDIMMPNMNGVEMCRLIKSCEEISHTPIMVLSGDTTIKNQIDSFTIGGADGYLEKPFSIELFKGKVEAILNNRELLKRRFNQESIIAPESIARTPADQKCISKVISIVKKNLSNSELSIEYIAQEYGVSRTYLNRKIKAITGETSTQFIRNIRLKYAAKLMLQKSMTVWQVAWAVGYNDVNTFRSRFKEMFGVLPTAYNGEPAIISYYASDDDIAM